MTNGTQIRDLVHTIKSKDLTPGQIESGFGEIFLSKDTITNQMESQEIVAQMQVVKVPTFGSSIPNTTRIVTKVGDSGIVPLFVPEANKTYQLIGSDVANTGSGSMNVVLGLYNGTNFMQLNQITVASSATGIFNTRNAYTFDSGVYPAVLITIGTASDALFQLTYSELVQ